MPIKCNHCGAENDDNAKAANGFVGLHSITIPDSVTTIGSEAFFCCFNLQTIIIPSGTKEKFRAMLPEEFHSMLQAN